MVNSAKKKENQAHWIRKCCNVEGKKEIQMYFLQNTQIRCQASTSLVCYPLKHKAGNGHKSDGST